MMRKSNLNVKVNRLMPILQIELDIALVLLSCATQTLQKAVDISFNEQSKLASKSRRHIYDV